jgi:hemerythrin-like domain-containing protein
MNNPQTPDFNDPLAILRSDHARILEHCEILEQLLPHLAENAVDDKARSAISSLLHYFTSGAVHHHLDKEQHLYPILNRQSLKLADIVYRLKREQDELAGLWKSIEGQLKTPATLQDNKAFATEVEKFCSDYRQHLAYETRELLGIAQHILSQRQLQELGDAMAKRRGVKR